MRAVPDHLLLLSSVLPAVPTVQQYRGLLVLLIYLVVP